MYGLLNLIYRFYPLAIVALLAAGSIWLERATRSPEPAEEATIIRTPDFTADMVRITGFTKEGKLYYTLDSPHLLHLPATDTTHIEQPRMQLISQGRRIRIDADRGEVGPKGRQVDLTGNVEAERESIPPDPPLRLSSSQLTVWPQEQRAISNVPVRLSQGQTHTDANYLEADNVFGEMKLSGKVRMLLTPRPQRNP